MGDHEGTGVRRTTTSSGEHAALAGDWALWRDFAVRSAGFPVAGLDAFGTPDEGSLMRQVAADPLFREAIAWQNRPALVTQVDAVAGDAPQSPSKRRRREAVVANYWQRYCAKNDMIGFFGPLAWGRIRDDAPAITVRSAGLVASREVHFETWCMEAIARAIDPALRVPLRLRPEREVRAQIEALDDPVARGRATHLLDELEAAREDVARVTGPSVVAALERFDETFVAATGAPPERPQGSAGGRTPLYLDCTRDLEVDVGPEVVRELAGSLPPFLDSARWYCSRSYAIGQRIVSAELGAARGPRPLTARHDRIMTALRALPELLEDDLTELQRRWADLLDTDPSDLVERAAAAFGDAGPCWPQAIYQSPDIQIAASSVEDIRQGRFLAVVGDFHPANALLQGMFSERHPDPARLSATVHQDLGSPLLYVVPHRSPGVPIDARIVPSYTCADDLHVTVSSRDHAREGYRTVRLDDLLVDGESCTDRTRSFRAPIADLFQMPMFLAAMHTFDPFRVREAEATRVTIGRTVLRRHTWAATARSLPTLADDLAAWARARGLPRRVFCRPPGEAKPVYVDLDSPLLTHSLHRMLSRVATRDPAAEVRFTEMLPGPDQCWLEHDGSRYTCELRLVAVDLSRRGAGRIGPPPTIDG